jgi:hypothetical protein
MTSFSSSLTVSPIKSAVFTSNDTSSSLQTTPVEDLIADAYSRALVKSLFFTKV